ncbi:MAG: hypothetical protein KDB90_12960 [Planctomycetes bacterium]|nr:hypothetical protein [Planctomycetota bacterium]
MYRYLALCVTCTLTVLWTALPADAQKRGGSSPFTDFHKQSGLAIGKSAPAMHLQDSEGDEFDLRDKLGSWVFIEFGSYT